jgi:putative transposase
LKPRFPAHVVLRIAKDVGSLRKRDIYKAFRQATIAVFRHEADAELPSFRIVHLSLQRTHVHLLVEAESQAALSSGMQRFQISAAKRVNRVVSAGRGERRRGSVFPDRFHQEIIESPRQARRALSYVLNNWRKHAEDRSGRAQTFNVDPFSTGALFTGWKELAGTWTMWKWPETYDPMLVYLPRTWLLAEGWKKAGAVSYFDVPSERRR